MKSIQITSKIRKASHCFVALILISCALMVACNKEDDDDMPDPDYPVSYVSFNIVGSIVNGDYEYKDASDDDEFNTQSGLYTTDENPDFSEDQIQLYIGKSFTNSNFTLVAPPQPGSHTIVYTGQANKFNIKIQLSSLSESYYAKHVTVKIDELDINGKIVKHCKGTFEGAFYRNNLVEANVHQIEGEFEINR